MTVYLFSNVATCRRNFRPRIKPCEQPLSLAGAKFESFAALEPRWQLDIAKAHAHQPAHLEADCIEHTAHDAVAPFLADNAVPTIGAVTAFRLNALKFGTAITEHNPIQQITDLLIR